MEDRSLCNSINPVESVSLRSRQMKVWNGGTSSKLCLYPNKQQVPAASEEVGRIVQEANAYGKAVGYADVNTAR